VGEFATGFLTTLGDAAKKHMDDKKSQADAEKSKQADIYWGVIKNPDSSPEQITYAQSQLQKMYGKAGPLGEMFKKFGGLLQQVHPGAQQQPQQGGGIAPPPQPGVASSTPGAAPSAADPAKSSAIPPPPQPPKGTDARLPEMAKAAGSTTGADEKEFQKWNRMQTVQKQNKIEEEQAQAKAKAQYGGSAGTPPRPVFSRPTSILDARTLAQGGKVYEGEDGNPLDVDKLPDNMSLQPYTTRVTETDDDGNTRQVWKTRYLPISPDQRKVTIGKEEYAVNPADQSKIPQGAGTELGPSDTPSTTRTTDPATGQTVVSTKTPTITGAAGRAAPATTSPSPKTSPTSSVAPPAKSPASPKSAPGTGTPLSASTTGPKGAVTPAAPRGLPPLDADGHVPASAPVAPQVLEGANQLLDGQDVNKLPAKTRDLSAKLARAYGWEQGKFTPKEQTMLREATTFIDDAMGNDKALAVLDEGWLDRQKITQVVDSVDAKGMISRAITTAAAQNLTDDEAEFVRAYNQLVGTISGFGQLVRSGRATEATIERLKKELPNPMTTKDSKDAMARLQRLRKEIDVGLQKGTFTGSTTTSPSRKSSVAAPPPGPNSSLDEQLKYEIEHAGTVH
jgi:hypothetical protein